MSKFAKSLEFNLFGAAAIFFTTGLITGLIVVPRDSPWYAGLPLMVVFYFAVFAWVGVIKTVIRIAKEDADD